MKIISFIRALLVPITLAHAFPAFAVIDNTASVVQLRDPANGGCTEGGVALNNCFISMDSLQTYIYVNRTNNTAPLLIEIGPGVFTAANGWSGFGCQANNPVGNSGSNGGNLTFRGAGIDKTVLQGNPYGILNNCPQSNWAFENLNVTGGLYSVVWYGGGNTTWTNVVFNGGWYDQLNGNFDACPPGQQGTHRFFSSRIIGKPAGHAYFSACGDSWFWGSEIIQPTNETLSSSAIRLIGAANRLHLYGSNIRVEATPTAAPSTTSQHTAITVSDNAEIHTHGVGIDLIGKDGWIMTALDASSGGLIHADASAYFVQPSTNITFRRIVNNGGHVHASYLWQHIPTQTFASVTGADTTTVTAGTSDGQPHLVIYSAACPDGSPGWYDSTDKICRR